MTLQIKMVRMLSIAATVMAFAGPQVANAALSKGASDADAVVPADAEAELLWEGGSWLESPTVAPSGEIYFSDLIEGSDPRKLGVIRVFDPRTRKTRLFRSPSFGSNGLLFDANGHLLAAHGAKFGGRYVTRTDLATNMSEIVAGLYKGR